MGKELGEKEASGVAGSMGLTFLVAVIGKYKVTDLGDFSESIDKFLKPASVPSVLQSIRVALGSACTRATTSVGNKGDTSL